MKSITLNDERWVTVPEFARITGRPTGQLYSLVKRGNSVRKLVSKTLDGKLYVKESEVREYPFNEAVRVAIEKDQELKQVRNTLYDAVESISKVFVEFRQIKMCTVYTNSHYKCLSCKVSTLCIASMKEVDDGL